MSEYNIQPLIKLSAFVFESEITQSHSADDFTQLEETAKEQES